MRRKKGSTNSILMERGDTVKFNVTHLRIISIIEEEGLVVALPIELPEEAINAGVTMETRFKFPLDYLKECGVESESDYIEMEGWYCVCHMDHDYVLLQDLDNHYYIKAKEFQLY